MAGLPRGLLGWFMGDEPGAEALAEYLPLVDGLVRRRKPHHIVFS